MTEAVNFKHQWMFSILPVGTSTLVAVGLCRVCHAVLTNALPWTAKKEVTMSHSIPNFPDFGCIDTRE